MKDTIMGYDDSAKTRRIPTDRVSHLPARTNIEHGALPLVTITAIIKITVFLKRKRRVLRISTPECSPPSRVRTEQHLRTTIKRKRETPN